MISWVSPLRLAETFLGAFALTQRGWSLWDQRGEGAAVIVRDRQGALAPQARCS